MPFPKKQDVREPIPARVEIDLTHTVGRWRGFGSTVFSFQEPELVERPGERAGEIPPEEICEELLKMVYHEVRLNRGRIFPFRYEHEIPEPERKRPASEWSKDDLVRRGVDRVHDYLLPAMDMGLNEIIGSIGVWDMPPHMTETNGRALKSEAFEEYVERVMRVLDYWRAEYGLELTAWSLFNEPNFPLKEPTALNPEGHVRLTRMLGRAFAKARLPTRIISPTLKCGGRTTGRLGIARWKSPARCYPIPKLASSSARSPITATTATISWFRIGETSTKSVAPGKS